MSTTHEFDVLLFDNDGTLTNSMPGVEAAWNILGNEYGFDGKEAADSTHGMRPIESVRKWCKIEDNEALIAAVHRFEAAVIEFGPVPLPGALALLEQIRNNAPTDRIGWGICTSASRWYATQVLERVGIGKPEVLVTSEDVQRGKPHPDPFLEGAKRCQAPDNSRVLVFEDAVSGVASGKAAGMKVLAVQTTTPREALQALDPDFLVPDLSHVSAEWNGGKILITVRD